MEAVKLLDDRHGVSMPQDGDDSGLSKKRTEMYGANREAARFFHAKLYSPMIGIAGQSISHDNTYIGFCILAIWYLYVRIYRAKEIAYNILLHN